MEANEPATARNALLSAGRYCHYPKAILNSIWPWAKDPRIDYTEGMPQLLLSVVKTTMYCLKIIFKSSFFEFNIKPDPGCLIMRFRGLEQECWLSHPGPFYLKITTFVLKNINFWKFLYIKLQAVKFKALYNVNFLSQNHSLVFF